MAPKLSNAFIGISVFCLIVIGMFLLDPARVAEEPVEPNTAKSATPNNKKHDVKNSKGSTQEFEESYKGNVDSSGLEDIDFAQRNQNVKNITQSNTVIDKQQIKYALDLALVSIPMNYHSVFQGKDWTDEQFLTAYLSAQSEINEELSLFDSSYILDQLNGAIYQHERNVDVSIEMIDCMLNGCVVYGVELESGAWNQILESLRGQSWWTFEKDVTRNSVGLDGNLIFFTVIN